MTGFVLALSTVVLMQLGAAVVIRLLVNTDSPFHQVRRRLVVWAAARREVSDLDARYEELVRSLSQPDEPHP